MGWGEPSGCLFSHVVIKVGRECKTAPWSCVLREKEEGIGSRVATVNSSCGKGFGGHHIRFLFLDFFIRHRGVSWGSFFLFSYLLFFICPHAISLLTSLFCLPSTIYDGCFLSLMVNGGYVIAWMRGGKGKQKVGGKKGRRETRTGRFKYFSSVTPEP